MQESIVLKPRQTGKGAARACRREGLIPGIVYGKSIEPVAVALDAQAVKGILSGSGTHVHHVVLEEPHFEGDVMLRDATYDPITGRTTHVDLHRVSMTEKVRLEVPLSILGEASLEKRGLILQRQMRKISVECLPGAIPDNVPVKVANLEHGGAVTAGELKLPEGVRLLTPPAEVLVVAVTPRAVEEEKEEEKPAAEGEAAAEPKAEKPEAPPKP